MEPIDSDDVRSLLDAARKRDYVALGGHALVLGRLAPLIRSHLNEGAWSNQRNRGQAALNVVAKVIGEMRPPQGTPKTSREYRVFAILFHYYLSAATIRETLTALEMGGSAVSRYRPLALEDFAGELQKMAARYTALVPTTGRDPLQQVQRRGLASLPARSPALWRNLGERLNEMPVARLTVVTALALLAYLILFPPGNTELEEHAPRRVSTGAQP